MNSFVNTKGQIIRNSSVNQINFVSDEVSHAAALKIQFPQSIANEEMDVITHPAIDMIQTIKARKGKTQEAEHIEKEKDKNLLVPKFWDPSSLFKDGVRNFLGNHGERLITPDEANAIGSFTKRIDNNEETSDKKYIQLSSDSTLLETIFVSIASYRDYRCPHTLRRLFLQATFPERIRVAIVDQLKPGEDNNCAKPITPCTEHPDDALCKYSHLIDVYEMDASLSVGPVLARHIGSRMYRGEYFAMQSDAHMEFVKGWDADIISQWKSAHNEMAVLSTYVSDVNGHYNATTGRSDAKSRPKMCVTDFDPDYYDNRLNNLMHGQQPEGRPDVTGEPTLQPFWAAGFSFARGHFIIQVPYDQYLPMIFQGEEINIGIRGFTYGYDYYAPERSVIFHYYSHGGKDKKVKTFWENSKAYNGLEQASMARLLGITELLPTQQDLDENVESTLEKDEKDGKENEKNKAQISPREEIQWNTVEYNNYGIGRVRTVKKFLQTFGIDISTSKVEKHLCRFVGRPMNNLFLQHLRKDGMGIDYDQISFQFKDPVVHGQSWEGNNGDDQSE